MTTKPSLHFKSPFTKDTFYKIVVPDVDGKKAVLWKYGGKKRQLICPYDPSKEILQDRDNTITVILEDGSIHKLSQWEIEKGQI